MSTHVKKKLLLVTPLYPPDIGGPATYARMLERFLPAQGVDLRVVSFTRYRRFPKGISHFLYMLRLFYSAQGVDIIFALDPVSVGMPAAISARLRRKKFIVKVVGDYAWEQGVQGGAITASLDDYLHTPFSYGWRTRIRAYVERLVARRADTVIVPSEYLKKVVLSWGVDDTRLVVIPNVAIITRPTESVEEIRTTLGVGVHSLLSAGRLVPWKQFDYIMRALPELVKKFPDVKLFIAGDGPDKDRLINLAQTLGITEHVCFLGRLSTDELHRYMIASRAFVLMSTYEGLSHILIEALALGTPIIASDAGGNAEVLLNGRAGYLVPLNDSLLFHNAVESVFTDHVRTAQRVSAGTLSMERYTPTAHIERLRSYL